MDTITHGLAGYVIARSGLARRAGRLGLVAGVAASLLPDADALFGLFSGAEFYIRNHRGLTNSIFLAVPLAAGLAWLFHRISGLKRFRAFFLLCLVEILAHTFLDLLTSYGTMILSPFSDRRFSLDWLFIIDLPLTASFLFPIIFMALSRTNARRAARLSLVASSLYIGFCALNHQRALSLIEAESIRRGFGVEKVDALPQPLSPFHWALYAVTEETIHEGFVTLVGERRREASADSGIISQIWTRYQPPQHIRFRVWERSDGSPWVERASVLEGVRTYLWFARFPVARALEGLDGQHRVRFFDLRFGEVEGRRPFIYEVIFDRDGRVLHEGLKRWLTDPYSAEGL